MKLCRYILLILLTVAVPVSGFASVTMQHSHDTAQVGDHEHPHHADSAAGEMSENLHQPHTHNAAMQKTDGPSKPVSKCGCPCKDSGSCSGSVALLSDTVLPTLFPDTRQGAFSIQPHTLAAHHLDHLRPPIFAAI